MEIIIPFSFCATIVIANFMGALRKVDSSQLEGKIVDGRYADKYDYKYMASLQLNGYHVCSSVLFKQGFLLTAGDCSRYIARHMNQGKKKHTAVLGDRDLKAGQRVNVLKLAHIDRSVSYQDDIGMVMLADDVDYTRVQVMNLYEERFDLRRHGKDALVCGWGSVTQDDELNNSIGNAEYSENLHCLPLQISSRASCERFVKYGDFRITLTCAKAKFPGAMATLGDTGSPVTKVIEEYGNLTQYIIGIVLSTIAFKTDSYLRIIRTSAVVKDIKKMIEVLQSPEEGRIECSGSSDEAFMNESNKRHKI